MIVLTVAQWLKLNVLFQLGGDETNASDGNNCVISIREIVGNDILLIFE